MPRYNPAVVEPKWQQYWEQHKTFAAPRLPAGEKLYVLDMFPYPSGNGLHVGHPEGYTATDIVCRFERMNGKSVVHPMGWDAFGLPAEQHAIKTQQPPRVTTEQNIATFRRQLKMLGFSYDWDREVSTTDVEYFRWTQWIFLQLFDTWYDPAAQKGRPIAELPIPQDVALQGDLAVEKYRDDHRLAYQLEAPVNWCPALGTVLANEEVIGGLSERGQHPVVRIPLRQWMLRITAYADRLESDLEGLDWSEGIKALQRNWIGRSTGAEVDFFIGRDPAPGGKPLPAEFKQWRAARGESGFPRTPGPEVLRVFTTRPDTLYGATYMVIAPEHPLVDRLTMPERKTEVVAYCEQAARKSDLDRTDLAKHKTGVFTGSFAANPANNRPIPIWIADYVLAGYGTGAIMAVPAHDERDYEFAKQFDLPIVPVVAPAPGAATDVALEDIQSGKVCFADHGVAINSGEYDGTPTAEFKTKITAELAKRGAAREAVNYKLRDWLFSRQHFWGEPFPILHELDEAGNLTGRLRAVPAEELPVNLPVMTEFKPHGRPEPPLEEASKDWLYVTVDGKRYKRETNTMPQWAGSCWYFLRFLDPKNDKALIDPAIEKAWMPVDLYIGGAEHAVLHLLYARFWHKVLYDRGVVTTKEPFQKLVNQGMILGELEITGYQRADGSWVSARDVKEGENEKSLHKQTGEELREVRVAAADVKKEGDSLVLAADSSIRVDSRAYKMSKSRGNVINPDDVVKEYGADSLRLYEMFMGPLEATKPWATTGVNGVRGFLDRVWRMIVDDRAEAMTLHPAVQDAPLNEEQARVLHRTIRDVTQDIRRLSFNTAIAKMMEFTNFFTGADVRPREAMEKIVLLLSPLAPHIAEELWELLGSKHTLAYEPWPSFDPEKIKESSLEVPVQILGKVRGRVIVPADADDKTIEAAARADEKIAQLLEGKTIVKAIVVKGRLVNFVVK
ncbi:MAG: leucine--tRNA ligase [Planctomycetaceae bacterium]|nr:leucine--tRNA ligase [Planctomycetaceae bacterium]